MIERNQKYPSSFILIVVGNKMKYLTVFVQKKQIYSSIVKFFMENLFFFFLKSILQTILIIINT